MKAGFERLGVPDADLWWSPGFIPRAERAALFAAVRQEVPWEQHRLKLFGRDVDAPRLSCWIGDPDTSYTYSRTRFEPHPWTPALAALRDRIAESVDAPFNSVLANLYRTGRDGMGWHSDDEPELGTEPVIASLSLGEPRRFLFRHRDRAHRDVEIALGDGSLLIMRGPTQRFWQHSIPKTALPIAERINLTFRRIFPAATATA
jgi:alkylated DNA repair dioxygenase AlkB